MSKPYITTIFLILIIENMITPFHCPFVNLVFYRMVFVLLPFQGTLDGGRIGIAGQALGIAQVFFLKYSDLASSIERAINVMNVLAEWQLFSPVMCDMQCSYKLS